MIGLEEGSLRRKLSLNEVMSMGPNPIGLASLKLQEENGYCRYRERAVCVPGENSVIYHSREMSNLLAP